MIFTLKFLVDESTGKKLAEALISAGHDAKFVYDCIPGATDDNVLEAAEKEKRILITNDKGFGELIFRLQRPSSGVILLRLNRDSTERRIRTVFGLLENRGLDFYNHFIVVSESEFRIRKI